MKVSVIICTYAQELYDDFSDALESVLEQSYPDVEAIVVVDGNQSLADRIEAAYSDHPAVKIRCNETNMGLSASRNRGLQIATGDIVAFLDDDAIAAPDWIETLVEVYETQGAIAVGGKMVPKWVAGKPSFLPEEFYWLIGVTHRDFASPGEEVRNTFGSNISFKRDVLETLDGFDPRMGRRGSVNLQAEEPELCARMQSRFGQGVIYTPTAIVEHKVFAYRLDPIWLAKRAFWQGVSKRLLETILPASNSSEESTYLKQLICRWLPDRVGGLLRRPRWDGFLQLGTLLALLGLVGAGYAYATIRYWRGPPMEDS